MARDRQRAKQRRAKRQPGAGGPAAGSRSTKARDIGLDQTDADDAGLGNPPPPEPTKHAMPNVEEARMAESAGGGRRKRRSGVIGFLGACIDELKRVQWPDRRQVGQGTAVTLGFTVLAGGYLGLLDAIWKPLIEAIL